MGGYGADVLGPTVQVVQPFGLLLQLRNYLDPAVVGTDVCDRQAVSHQERVQFKSIVQLLCHLDHSFLGFGHLLFLDLRQLIRNEDEHTHCWL